MTPKQQTLELVRQLRKRKYEKIVIYKALPSVSEGKEGKNPQIPSTDDNHKREQ